MILNMKSLILIALINTAMVAHAQNRVVSQNSGLWFFNLSKMEVRDKWGFENELHFRLSDWNPSNKQFLIRPSIWYKWNKHIKAQLGYTHLETYLNGDQNTSIRIPENNLWIQLVLDHEIGGIHLSHRYRLEERWTGNVISQDGQAEVEGSLHRNRFRYRFTLKKALNKDIYLIAFDELWLNFGDNSGYNQLDQNWIYVGPYFQINNVFGLELGYLHQWNAGSDGIHFQSNNILQTTAHLKISQSKK